MKKLIFTLAALSLAFVGCNTDKEFEQPVENKALKVVVNMDKPSFGDDTRAARTDWEDGDEVVVMLSNGEGNFAHLKLSYDGTSKTWETKVLQPNSAGAFEEVIGAPSSLYDLIRDEDENTTSGAVNAAYFSSGIVGIYGVNVNLPDIKIVTNGTPVSGMPLCECVMTCEKDNGYTIENIDDELVLTLNITMIPKVAQFTIRGLNASDENLQVYINSGTITGYTGATITETGIVLNKTCIAGAPFWMHNNEDGISFYAHIWETLTEEDGDYIYSEPFTELGTFEFGVETSDGYWTRSFTGKTDLKDGGAVIMNGPSTPGAWEKMEK